MARNLAHPFHIDGRGTTAESEYSQHVREMIDLILFTAPGERVMRPDFGCGLAQLVFAPNGPELAAATEFLVQTALQQNLANLVELRDVRVIANDSTLTVQLTYVLKRTGELETRNFTRSAQQ